MDEIASRIEFVKLVFEEVSAAFPNMEKIDHKLKLTELVLNLKNAEDLADAISQS